VSCMISFLYSFSKLVHLYYTGFPATYEIKKKPVSSGKQKQYQYFMFFFYKLATHNKFFKENINIDRAVLSTDEEDGSPLSADDEDLMQVDVDLGE
jgi:hypothetical protein